MLLTATGVLRPSPRVPLLTVDAVRLLTRTEFVPAPYPFPATLACASKLAKWFPLRAPRSKPRLQAPRPSLLPQTRVGFPRPPLPSTLGSVRDAVRAARLQTAPFGAGPAGTPDLQTGKPWGCSRAAGVGRRSGAHFKSQFAKMVTCSGRTDARTPTKGKQVILRAPQVWRPVCSNFGNPLLLRCRKDFEGARAEPQTAAPGWTWISPPTHF